MKLVKELESGSIEAKVTYDQRDYYHHQDNEYNVGVSVGLTLSLGANWLLPPIELIKVTLDLLQAIICRKDRCNFL